MLPLWTYIISWGTISNSLFLGCLFKVSLICPLILLFEKRLRYIGNDWPQTSSQGRLWKTSSQNVNCKNVHHSHICTRGHVLHRQELKHLLSHKMCIAEEIHICTFMYTPAYMYWEIHFHRCVSNLITALRSWTTHLMCRSLCFSTLK